MALMGFLVFTVTNFTLVLASIVEWLLTLNIYFSQLCCELIHRCCVSPCETGVTFLRLYPTQHCFLCGKKQAFSVKCFTVLEFPPQPSNVLHLCGFISKYFSEIYPELSTWQPNDYKPSCRFICWTSLSWNFSVMLVAAIYIHFISILILTSIAFKKRKAAEFWQNFIRTFSLFLLLVSLASTKTVA